MNNKHVIGLGGIHASNVPQTIIKTLALGSCVAVIAVAPRRRAVGMVHIVLPDSRIDKDKATAMPGYFADTGIQALLNEFKKYGISSNHEFVIKLVGGSSVMDENRRFDIGKRNVLAARKFLWKNHMAALSEDIGGSHSRTVWVEVDTGRVFIESPGRGRWEI